MHLHAVILFQLTVQTVSALRISQTKPDPRAYLESRGEDPVRPVPVEHPVIPVVEPVHAPAPPQGNGQTDHGTDDRPLEETAPGLSNLIPNQGSQGQHVDFEHDLAKALNDWPFPTYAFLEAAPWEVEADGSGHPDIPLLRPPDSISKEYVRPPIGDASNKRKSSTIPLTYSKDGNKRAKRTEIGTDFETFFMNRLNEMEAEVRKGQEAGRAGQARIDQLESENKELRETIAAWELPALSSQTSDLPNEFDRMFASNGDYKQMDLLDFSIPDGPISGGFTFGDPMFLDSLAPDSRSSPDLSYFEGSLPSFENWADFPLPPEFNSKQRRAQSQSYRGINPRDTEQRQPSHISRRSDSPPTFNDSTSEYQYYIDVYTEIRVNVSNLLVPYFTPILEQANNSLIYDMVRSIHSDLTAYGPWTLGPYSNGHHCFDWIEYQLFGNITDDIISKNGTIKNETIAGVLANHAILIDIYDDIWGNATQIANATGYLAQMHTMRGYLNPKNTSIIPASWTSVQPLLDSLSFDVLYNKTLHS